MWPNTIGVVYNNMADEAKDPLSLLAGDSSSSESDGDDEKQEKRKSLTDESYYAPSTAQLVFIR